MTDNKMRKIGKRGNILTENIVFLVITLLFISMLFVFVTRSASKTGLVEESHAKKIALLIDSARPGTEILLNIDSLLDGKGGRMLDKDIVSISRNQVNVKITENSGRVYSFFNNVNVNVMIDESLEQGSVLKIIIK